MNKSTQSKTVKQLFSEWRSELAEDRKLWKDYRKTGLYKTVRFYNFLKCWKTVMVISFLVNGYNLLLNTDINQVLGVSFIPQETYYQFVSLYNTLAITFSMMAAIVPAVQSMSNGWSEQGSVSKIFQKWLNFYVLLMYGGINLFIVSAAFLYAGKNDSKIAYKLMVEGVTILILKWTIRKWAGFIDEEYNYLYDEDCIVSLRNKGKIKEITFGGSELSLPSLIGQPIIYRRTFGPLLKGVHATSVSMTHRKEENKMEVVQLLEINGQTLKLEDAQGNQIECHVSKELANDYKESLALAHEGGEPFMIEKESIEKYVK